MRLPRRGMNMGGRQASRGGLGGLLGGRFGIIIVALIGIAMYWFSNQEYSPYSGKKEFNTISVEKAQALGRQSYEQILAQEEQQRNDVLCWGRGTCTSDDQYLNDVVRKIGADLEQAAIRLEREYEQQNPGWEGHADNFEWTYYVVDSDVPNAFCLPGGYVAVYTRMLDLTGNFNGQLDRGDLEDLDMLAAVMGHEIGHALAHHGAKRMSQQQVVQFGQMAVGVGLGNSAESRALMQAFGVAAQGQILAFSREHETQADEIGLKLLAMACYDPREAPDLWRRMSKLNEGKQPPEWMSTHPSNESRIQHLESLMPEAIDLYNANCAGRSRSSF